ncbi:hypothetical protein GCM10009347_01800 [Shewanella algicola]|uniref:Uncharacterized protein n=1 Tax=Shewanella algicola TaxID=640633 RepID=A0A9X2CAU2_9GAMM|nr:hypothetical protein [Shewanella algicola]MCL1103718.1 hypothetical protein [Shewanella algicola]GGP37470.1 hypothetical protein GCM10009347_01800 [Shewanella algicola]
MVKVNVAMVDHRQSLLKMKELRDGLSRWGRYWAYQERGKGFANRSQCDKLGEVIVYGSAGVSDVTPPREVRQFDQLIERLAPQCIRAIRAHYICKGQWALMGFDSKQSYVYWLRRAEITMME